MNNLSFFRTMRRIFLVTAVAGGLALSFNIPAQAGDDVVERDLGSVVTEANSDSQVAGTPVAMTSSESPATEAKGDFKSGAKGIGSGFKNGTKATGRAFKKAGLFMGRGFKKAGVTMGRGFKKAGRSIKNFFTGNKSKNEVQERDLMAEGANPPTDSETIELKEVQEDDLEMDIETTDTRESNDWAYQDQKISGEAS